MSGVVWVGTVVDVELRSRTEVGCWERPVIVLLLGFYRADRAVEQMQKEDNVAAESAEITDGEDDEAA